MSRHVHRKNRYVVIAGMPRWPPDFRRDAVEKARSKVAPAADVARDLGVPPGTLRRWARSDLVQGVTHLDHENRYGRAAHIPPRPRVGFPLRLRSEVIRELVTISVMAWCGVAMVALSFDISRHMERATLWIPFAIACGAELGWLGADLLANRERQSPPSAADL